MQAFFTLKPARDAWTVVVAIAVTAWICLTDPAQRVPGPAEPWKS